MRTNLKTTVKWYKLQPCLVSRYKGRSFKGHVVSRTVYVDMHYKDLLGSIASVGYRITVPYFYLVLHDI